ncbi:hypothetical protein BH20CHL7_BH20CHL7_14990 [soil metagenome]
MIRLGAAETVAGRPFTAVELGEADLAVMERMLARLRRHVRETVGPGSARRDDRFTDASDGGVHRIVIPDSVALAATSDLAVVGFFGQARMDVDHTPIVDLEGALIADVAPGSGPLVYDNVFWPGEGWGNLVLFRDRAAKNAWGDDPRHAQAIARSPQHYHSIRLHNGVLPGGLLGDDHIRLTSTKYLDFSATPAWRAIRDLARPGPGT